MRRSSAQIDERRAVDGRGAHRDASGGERSVLESSEASRRRRRQRLEREEDAGEMEPGRIKTKKRNRWYIRARWVVAELEVTSASSLGRRSSGAMGDSGELWRRTEKREEDGGGRRGRGAL